MQRIHIVGLNPRTGTTLLAECMRTSFDIELAEQHEASISRLRRCKGVYLTKYPRDLYLIGTRLALDSRFHVLCMVRDPRDTVVSKHGKGTDDYFNATSLITFRHRWRLAQQYASNPRFMLIRYEDLIADPNAVQDRIAERLPFLKKRYPFSTFHQAGPVSCASERALNGVRPIDSSNRGKWINHLDRLREKLEEAGPIDRELFELGYESDPRWMQKAGLMLAMAGEPSATPANLLPKRRERLRSAVSAVLAGVCSRIGLAVG